MKSQLRFLPQLLVLALSLAVSASASVTISVSQPSTSTASVSTTTTLKASAISSASAQITAWYVYVNDRQVWKTGATSSIAPTITLLTGTSRVAIEAWDLTGAKGIRYLTLTASGSTPTPSGSGVTVSISEPTSTSVSTTTTLKATAASSKSITGWHVYVDDRSVWSAGATQSISAPITLTAGTHRVYARAWNASGAFGTAYITLSTSGGGGTTPTTNEGLPIPPSTAKVFTDVEDRTYLHCSDCAANPSDPTPPIAQYSMAQFQTSPSLSGNSTKFWVGGSTAFANALWWTKFGNQSWAKNFLWEYWVYVNEDSYKAQNLEFDVWQSVAGRKYMFGTQCNYYKKIWQGWDEQQVKWIDWPHIPCEKFTAGKWTRVALYVKRTSDNRLNYVTMVVGDKTHTINNFQPSGTVNWADSSGVQFQLDLNGSADDYSMWVDKVKLTIW